MKLVANTSFLENEDHIVYVHCIEWYDGPLWGICTYYGDECFFMISDNESSPHGRDYDIYQITLFEKIQILDPNFSDYESLIEN